MALTCNPLTQVLRRVEMSGALPVARDTPSYQALLGVLWGGGGAKLSDLLDEDEDEPDDSLGFDDSLNIDGFDDNDDDDAAQACFGETAYFKNSRADAKADAAARMQGRQQDAEMESLIGAKSVAGVTAVKAAMASTGRNMYDDAWSLEAAVDAEDMDAAFDRLDSLVAADLLACQEEMRALEAEVRALQNGGFDDDDSESSDEEIDAAPMAQPGARMAPPGAGLFGSFGTPVPKFSAAEEKGVALAEEKESHEPASSEVKGAAKASHSDAKGESLSRADAAAVANSQSDEKAAAPPSDDLKSREGTSAAVSGLKLQGVDRKCKTAQKKSARELLPLTARSKRSLLGDLPSLERQARSSDVRSFLDLKLEIPKGSRDKAKSSHPISAGAIPANGVPAEFACAINGHMMKDPVRSPGGIVFEKASIVLWLSTRGSICPISGKPLCEQDLVADTQLRTKIMRHHVSKSMVIRDGWAGATPATGNAEDDLYDF